MSLFSAKVLTPWVGGTDNDTDPRRPKLLDDHPLLVGASSSDTTGQPTTNLVPNPNLYTLRVDNVTDVWLSAVEADSNYGQGAVLWSVQTG